MWVQLKLWVLGQCWWKGHHQNRHSRHLYQDSLMMFPSNGTLSEIPQDNFISPEHDIMAHILRKQGSKSNYMKITYLDNCRPSSHLNGMLEALNWCLRVPKKHTKRSRWLGGQLVQKLTTSTKWQAEVFVCCASTSTCHLVPVVIFWTNCPPNHPDLFTYSFSTLRHQFDASRMSFKWLDGLQLAEYVIFI